MKRPACYADPATGNLYRWPVSRDEARALRLPRYTDLAGCPRCSTPGPKSRYVEGGECVGCLHVDAPRVLSAWLAGSPDAPPVVVMSAEEAVRLGADSFIGGDPEQGLLCRNGPHLRMTHIATGRCLTCAAARKRAVPVADGRATETSRMMAECPDLVLGRRDARALGLAVYRTGEPCLNGHTGWRYVSTGGCIDCLRGR